MNLPFPAGFSGSILSVKLRCYSCLEKGRTAIRRSGYGKGCGFFLSGQRELLPRVRSEFDVTRSRDYLGAEQEKGWGLGSLPGSTLSGL